MTELFLVRHGQTDWNVEGRYQGQSDIPLNATGRAEARALAIRLAAINHGGFQAVYASDLLRARETAQILAAPLGLPVRLDPRLREIGLGSWEGMLFNELYLRYPEEMQRRAENLRDYRSPGGETAGEVAARMAAVADEIAHRHPTGRVVVVSHGLALATLYCRAQGISEQDITCHIPANATPVKIAWGA